MTQSTRAALVVATLGLVAGGTGVAVAGSGGPQGAMTTAASRTTSPT